MEKWVESSRKVDQNLASLTSILSLCAPVDTSSGKRKRGLEIDDSNIVDLNWKHVKDWCSILEPVSGSNIANIAAFVATLANPTYFGRITGWQKTQARIDSLLWACAANITRGIRHGRCTCSGVCVEIKYINLDHVAGRTADISQCTWM